jgi:hypothetical protein
MLDPYVIVLLIQIYAVFESIKPDYHIDLHTFSTLSIPFIFLDRFGHLLLSPSCSRGSCTNGVLG